MKIDNFKKGFTLIEAVVSVGIFVSMALIVTQIYVLILNQIISYREQTTVSALADQYLEIARNLPYSQIGTLSGNPHGNLPDMVNALSVNFNGTNYEIYYTVNYVDDLADGTIIAGTDSAPNDYKQIKLYIKNTVNNVLNSFLANMAPKSLEGMQGGGALSIKVFNAVGQPVPGAAIHITNNIISPAINLTRTSDINGDWVEVGLPNSANSYHISVTKNTNYSTDQTYPASPSNPNPIKSDATISDGQVTQISFSIDILSNLSFNINNQVCSQLSGVDLEIRGSKVIGLPNVLKFDNIYTSNSSGEIALNNIEWDSYTPALISSSYMIYGTSPIQQANILPNTSQNFALIIGPKTDNSLLVAVKDASSSNPIEGANVNLQKDAVNIDKLTSGSVWSQNDWSGGAGQLNFIDETKYYQDDGNISGNVIPLGLRLASFGGYYYSSGSLISSGFDTGTELSSYTTLTWLPASQDPATSIKFQIATNNDNLTWNYIGPDGTADTYYTVSGTTINAINSNQRYIRYKTFLSTTDTLKTPVLTSIDVNYVSGCSTPGQAMFPGLSAGSNYQATISADGYETQIINDITISQYNVLEILLSH
ncbi:MAG: hypothetical protein AAB352_04115 [Patescibacteria group bacterium]